MRRRRTGMMTRRKRFGGRSRPALNRLRQRRRARMGKGSYRRYITRFLNDITIPSTQPPTPYVQRNTEFDQTRLVNDAKPGQLAAMIAMYDEVKCVSVHERYWLAEPAENLTDRTDDAVLHFSLYDPDSAGRLLKDVTSYAQNESSKWHIMKPYQVRSSALKRLQFGQVLPQGIATTRSGADNTWFKTATLAVNMDEKSRNGEKGRYDGV